VHHQNPLPPPLVIRSSWIQSTHFKLISLDWWFKMKFSSLVSSSSSCGTSKSISN
jgi:hypothetical protein